MASADLSWVVAAHKPIKRLKPQALNANMLRCNEKLSACAKPYAALSAEQPLST
jgi:hypothetical protein